MRTFIGGISKYLVNWHYYPKNYNIFTNRNEFMMNSMVKSLGSPPIDTNSKIIQLEELYIDKIDDKKIILEILDNKKNLHKLENIQQLRENYPEYNFVEKSIISINVNTCNQIDNLVRNYLQKYKHINKDYKLLIQNIEIDSTFTGLYVKVR